MLALLSASFLRKPKFVTIYNYIAERSYCTMKDARCIYTFRAHVQDSPAEANHSTDTTGNGREAYPFGTLLRDLEN